MVLEDSQTGTPVTLVISPGNTVAPPPPGRKPIPFTGFDLVPALLLGAVLLAVGILLTASSRRAPIRVRAPRPR